MTTVAGTDSSSSVPVYTFKWYDPGNNFIQCEGDPSLPIFLTTTTKNFLDTLKHTLIVCQRGGEKAVKIQGEIDWKNKRVTVEGVSKPLFQARRKLGGLFSFDAEWTWPSGTYTITWKSGTYTVKRNAQDLAVYTSLKVNAFSKNEPATLKFLVDVPDEEKVFLAITLMFRDFQLKPVAEPKSLKRFAAEEGGKLAVSVTANAISGCCVIQ